MYLGAVVLDCGKPGELADFYAALLGWQKHEADADWVFVKEDGGQGAAIVFQMDENYQPPVWPAQPGAQAQMAHVDFYSSNVVADVRHALACGARLCDTQCDDGWRVLLDPAGHPFCIIPTSQPDAKTRAAIAALSHKH